MYICPVVNYLPVTPQPLMYGRFPKIHSLAYILKGLSTLPKFSERMIKSGLQETDNQNQILYKVSSEKLHLNIMVFLHNFG